MDNALRLRDLRAVADLDQFARRAQRLDENAAVSVAAHGPVAVVTASPLYGTGLNDKAPTLLAVKVLELAEPSTVRFVSPAQAITDRAARMRSTDDTVLRVPPVEVLEVWAAITPPRAGWAPVAQADATRVGEIARAGIERVRAGVPDVAGELAVHELRARVWSVAEDDLAGFVSGVAFALEGFGFLAEGQPVALSTNGRWQRASAAFGDVIARPSRNA